MENLQKRKPNSKSVSHKCITGSHTSNPGLNSKYMQIPTNCKVSHELTSMVTVSLERSPLPREILYVLLKVQRRDKDSGGRGSVKERVNLLSRYSVGTAH